MICTHAAPQLDGMHRAIGRLNEESLSLVQTWESTILTRHGTPSSYDLVVVDGGIMSGPAPDIAPATTETISSAAA
jgi:hypothetical protein